MKTLPRFLPFVMVSALFGLLPNASHAKSTAQERDLIAVISVSALGDGGIKSPFFKAEEKNARRKTLKIAPSAYHHVKVFYRDDATLKNLLKAIQDSESDPQVKDIDVVLYLHGDDGVLGFVDYPDFITSKDVATQIRALKSADGSGPRKLRALYSDACFGATHADDLLSAGFKVYAGGEGNDTNKSVDYGRFLREWVAGTSFRASIHWANKAWITRISDFLEGGDCAKVVYGAGNLSIGD